MTQTTSAAFPWSKEQTARLAQALSHPTRLAILHFLSDRKPHLSGEICAALPLARTTVSQHLVALRKQGLLRAESKGLTMTYSLNVPALGELVRTVGGFLAALAVCPRCGKKTGCACGVGQ